MEVSVIIQSGANRLFWQSLEKALSKEPDISVRMIEKSVQIKSILRKQQPQILIVEIPPEESQRGQMVDYQRYLNEYSDLVIIGIDQESADILIRMRDIDPSVFIHLIRTLANRQESQRLRLVTPTDLKKIRSVTEQTDMSDGTDTLIQNPILKNDINDAMRWLDLCLYQRLAKEVATDDAVRAPAWAMTASCARALVGSEYEGTSDIDLENRREELEEKVFGCMSAEAGSSKSSKFIELCNSFGLSKIERLILLMVLAPEFDGRYARVFGFLNDDLSQRRPSATLLAQLLMPDDSAAWHVRQYLTNDYPLGQHGLIRLDPSDLLPGSDAGIIPTPELIDFLVADENHLPNYASFLTVLLADTTSTINGQSTRTLRETLLQWYGSKSNAKGQAPIIQLIGDTATLQWFEYGALDSGQSVVVQNLGILREDKVEEIRNHCMTAARVARLYNAILLVIGRPSLNDHYQQYFDSTLLVELHCNVSRLVVHGEVGWLMPSSGPVLHLERPIPDVAERSSIWQDRASALGVSLSKEDANIMAAITRFSEPEIDMTLRRSDPDTVDRRSLQLAARCVSRSAVPGMVQRIEAVFKWKDIVLPDPVMSSLRQIPGHIFNSGMVLDDWGYRDRIPYGQGVAALFAGPSGTGKTMAAQIIANELGVELFQVDLAKIVSKYIGETEKNLDLVFSAAEKASAVLLFDEADALFGKRTEVRDAHDRYANVEVAYLLQRIDAYKGLAILTTNMPHNIDKAFTRRLRFVVEFVAPSRVERESIWKKVFPDDAPLADDVNFAFLARRIEITGGNIQQIAVRAAFSAASCSSTIEMSHIAEATREELRKLGMTNAEKTLAELAA